MRCSLFLSMSLAVGLAAAAVASASDAQQSAQTGPCAAAQAQTAQAQSGKRVYSQQPNTANPAVQAQPNTIRSVPNTVVRRPNGYRRYSYQPGGYYYYGRGRTGSQYGFDPVVRYAGSKINFDYIPDTR
jgi:hypothetical protein